MRLLARENLTHEACNLHNLIYWMSSLHQITNSTFYDYFQATPNDGLPPIVCNNCRDQLDSCHRFRRVAHQTHQVLVDYLQFTSKLNGTPQVSYLFFIFHFGFFCLFENMRRNCIVK